MVNQARRVGCSLEPGLLPHIIPAFGSSGGRNKCWALSVGRGLVLRGHSGVGDVSFEFLLGAQRALMWGRLAAGRASRQAMSTALKYSALKYTAHQLLSESLPSFTEAIIYCKNTLFYFILIFSMTVFAAFCTLHNTILTLFWSVRCFSSLFPCFSPYFHLSSA